MKRTISTFAVFGVGLLLVTAARATVTPAQKCAAAKLLAAGKKTAAILRCQKTFILSGDAMKQAACLTKAEQVFAAAFQKAETKGGCATTGDVTSVEASVDACVSTIANELPCPGGEALCGDLCVNLLTDPLNCGACGTKCSTTDCGPNVSSVGCSSGMCKIASCASGTYDANGLCSDGCECVEEPGALVCSVAQSVGTLGSGQSIDISSNLPAVGETKFYVVTFAAGGSPSITLSAGFPEFWLNLWRDCTGTTVSCVAANLCTPAAGTYVVRVYRPSGAPTCDNYTLHLSN